MSMKIDGQTVQRILVDGQEIKSADIDGVNYFVRGWDLTYMTLQGNWSIPMGGQTGGSITDISDDLSLLFHTSYNNTNDYDLQVNKLALSTPGDPSTASVAQTVVLETSSKRVAGKIVFSPDGANAIAVYSTFIPGELDTFESFLASYTLSTAWDLSTISKQHSFKITDTVTDYLAVTPDGLNLITESYRSHYSLTTPWDVSTATYQTDSQGNNGDPFVRSPDISTDGAKTLFYGNETDGFSDFILGEADVLTPFDFNTLSAVDQISLSGTGMNAPEGFIVSPDGADAYFSDVSNSPSEVRVWWYSSRV